MTDAGEYVRGHVQRMRGIGSDVGIALRRLQSLVGNGRIVVAVDQIMRHAGVVGLGRKQRLEHLGRLQLVGIGFVGWIEIGRGDQRGDDRRLLVVGIATGKLAHGVIEGVEARGVGHLLVVAHEHGCRLHIVLLALALEAGSARGSQGRRDLVQLCRLQIAGPDEGIVEHDHGAAPVRHAAARVGLGDAVEGLHRIVPGERMVERHGPVEVCLHDRRALDLEFDLAQPAEIGPGVLRRVVTCSGGAQPDARQQQGHQGEPAAGWKMCRHGSSPIGPKMQRQ